MSMITSQILKFGDPQKTETSEYLKNETRFFLKSKNIHWFFSGGNL